MISIVIIGKDEAGNLPKLYASLNGLEVEHELIYVDSASSDNSVEISMPICDEVIELAPSEQLCAAAGRFEGTKEAKYDWILYLDGDMELETEFITFLNQRTYLAPKDDIAGYIGYYTYIYSDGSEDFNTILQPKDKVVSHFGGAVFLQKHKVLSAGNWNPSVVANEEIDLYIRMQDKGYHVYGLDKKMVRHQAKKTSNIHTLFGLIYPLHKTYYGYGQALVSQYKHETLGRFVKEKPYPFMFAVLLIGAFWNSYSLVLLFAIMIYVTYTKKVHYNILYLTDIIRGFFGVLSYKTFIPKRKD